MLVSILSNIMIFNMPQCAGLDKICATKAVWSRSRWLDKRWKHSVPWPSFQYGLSLSLSLSPDACTHIQSILKDSLGKKCTWTTLHLSLKCVLFQCYFKGLISIGRIIVNHWFGLFFQFVYHAKPVLCEKIIVAGDVVKESLILELCGDSSMFTLLKIKSSYEYLEDMIKE